MKSKHILSDRNKKQALTSLPLSSSVGGDVEDDVEDDIEDDVDSRVENVVEVTVEVEREGGKRRFVRFFCVVAAVSLILRKSCK